MIYDNIEFHNVAELRENECRQGLLLCRVPKNVSEHLSILGSRRAIEASGCEIRLVVNSQATLYIGSLNEDGQALIFCGDYFLQSVKLKCGVITSVHLQLPNQFERVTEETLAKTSRFAPHLFRVVFGRNSVVFYGIEHYGKGVRPPNKNELPLKRLLAYGSSITQGAGALLPAGGYVHIAARKLGVDLINYGLGGACHCEKEMADFLAECNGWDFVTLELGVNMREKYTPEEFRIRTKYLIESIISKHPEKKMAVISIFTNSNTNPIKPTLSGQREIAYNEILKDITHEHGITLINGQEILDDFTCLTTDLIHPSDYGHFIMGERLAEKLKNFFIVQNKCMEG